VYKLLFSHLDDIEEKRFGTALDDIVGDYTRQYSVEKE
jgi:hypothetical protein